MTEDDKPEITPDLLKEEDVESAPESEESPVSESASGPVEEVAAADEPIPAVTETPVVEPSDMYGEPPTVEPSDMYGELPEDEPSEVRDEFKPYYKKEARSRTLVNGVLFVFLVLLGLSLIGLVVDSYFKSAPFRLEFTTTAVICFALIGFLWKIISLEAKLGLAALSIGVLLTISQSAAPGLALTPLGLPTPLLIPIFYALSAAALLFAVWLLWPRLHWLPLVLTLLGLYVALAPAWPLAKGGAAIQAVLTGPVFMEGWPVYIRSGWLLVQVFLPLGVLLFFVLQARNLLRAPYEKHWGYFFWALFLALASITGLIALERAEKPAFPSLVPVVARVYPSAALPAPSPVPESVETAAPSPAAPAESAAAEDVAPESAAAETAPSEEPAATPETVSPETTEATGPASDTPAPPVEETESAETPSPAEAMPPAAGPDEAAELRESVEKLKQEIEELKDSMASQERLLRAILRRLETPPPAAPYMPGPPTPPLEEETPPPPAPEEPPVDQDYT